MGKPKTPAVEVVDDYVVVASAPVDAIEVVWSATNDWTLWTVVAATADEEL